MRGAGRASTWSTPRRCPRSPARSGRWSSAPHGRPPRSRASGSWCTAASSGIGTMAIQLAARPRRRRCSPPPAPQRKLDVCRELGADVRDQLPRRGLRRGDRGRDRRRRASTSSSTTWARPYLPRNVAALATGGRLVVLGMQGGAKGELDLGALLAKRAHRPRAPGCGPGRRRRRRPSWPRRRGARLAADRGRRRCVRSSTGCCRWTTPAEAHRLVEASEHIGKVAAARPADRPPQARLDRQLTEHSDRRSARPRRWPDGDDEPADAAGRRAAGRRRPASADGSRRDRRRSSSRPRSCGSAP